MTHSILFVLVALFVPLLTSAENYENIGGWSPIKNLNNPHVIEIANFSVSDYNKQSKTNLTFTKVVKGETQVLSGINYRLIVVVQNGAATEQYASVIWEKSLLHLKKLISFKHLLKDTNTTSTSNDFGDDAPIKDVNDPHVIEIAQFGVSEHNKHSKSNLKLEKVVEGEKEVEYPQIYYSLVIIVKNGDAIEKYVTKVLEEHIKHSKTLLYFIPINY